MMPKYPEIGERNMCNNEERGRGPRKKTQHQAEIKGRMRKEFFTIYAFI
jgi:hypothetical protein